MPKMLSRACLIAIAMILVSCSSSEKHANVNAPAAPHAPSNSMSLDPGIRFLQDQKYSEANDFFEKFLTAHPVSDLTPTALYYQGLAQMNLGQFAEAEKSFKGTIRLTEGKDRYLEADGLFNLAKAHEGQGEDAKALATLFDAEKRAAYLKPEISQVEIPARIGAIYIRQGQLDLAEKYYNRADQGLVKLRGRDARQKEEWIPRALYGMGKLSPRPVMMNDFDSGLRVVRRSQGYLLRAIEINHGNWSKKAEGELESIYESAWKVIENLPVEPSEDKLLALKKQQDRMIELGLLLNGVVTDLKQEFLPSDEKNPHVEQLKIYVEGYSKRLQALIAARPVSEGLTPEAQEREGIMREGKVIDSSGELEKDKPRLQEKLPSKKENKK